MLRLACHHCSARFQVPEEYQGRHVACPRCRNSIEVPRHVAIGNQAAPVDAAGDPRRDRIAGLRWAEPPHDYLPDGAERLGRGLAYIQLKATDRTPGQGKWFLFLVWPGLALVAFSVVQFMANEFSGGQNIQWGLSGCFLLPLGGVLLVIGLFGLGVARSRSYSAFTLWICEGGLLWRWGRRGWLKALSWQDLDECRMIPRGVTESGQVAFDFELNGNAGIKLVFSDRAHPRCRDVAVYILKEAARALFPGEQRKMAAGEVLTFDMVQLDNQCLAVDGQRIPWPHVRGVRTGDGNLLFQVAGRDQPLVCPGADVIHPFLVIALCRSMMQRFTPGLADGVEEAFR